MKLVVEIFHTVGNISYSRKLGVEIFPMEFGTFLKKCGSVEAVLPGGLDLRRPKGHQQASVDSFK